MIFSESADKRLLEKLMTRIPNFRPRGHGVIVMQSIEYEYETGICSIGDIMFETMKHISHPAFIERLNKFIEESEESPMDFKNEKHRQIFTQATKKLDRKNKALISAIYLLTADNKLWNQVRGYVEHGAIRFERFRPHDSTEAGYTLFCCAKDLYLGTKHLSISDLADAEIIPPKVFGLICNAMAIRRFGMRAFTVLKEKKNETNN